jgi:hypothetical protein
MTSGGTQGIADDSGPSSHQLSVDNLFQQAGDWRALEESMPAPCDTSDSGDYAVRHSPALYYVGLQLALRGARRSAGREAGPFRAVHVRHPEWLP